MANEDEDRRRSSWGVTIVLLTALVGTARLLEVMVVENRLAEARGDEPDYGRALSNLYFATDLGRLVGLTSLAVYGVAWVALVAGALFMASRRAGSE